jgi:hypothetical protein
MRTQGGYSINSTNAAAQRSNRGKSVANPIQQLREIGQSIWLDNITREKRADKQDYADWLHPA